MPTRVRLQNDKWESWVTMDMQPQEHYSIEHEGPVNVKCWVASKLDSPFEVHVQKTMINDGGKSFIMELFLDGKKTFGNYLFPAGTNQPATRTGFRLPNLEVQRFKFSAPLAKGNKSSKNPQETKLGIIRVAIHKVRIRGITEMKSEDVPRDLEVPRDSDEAKMHFVGGGPIVDESNGPFVDYRSCEFLGPPVAGFIFHYQPLEMLQKRGIAPAQFGVQDQMPVASGSGKGRRRRAMTPEESDFEPSDNASVSQKRARIQQDMRGGRPVTRSQKALRSTVLSQPLSSASRHKAVAIENAIVKAGKCILNEADEVIQPRPSASVPKKESPSPPGAPSGKGKKLAVKEERKEDKLSADELAELKEEAELKARLEEIAKAREAREKKQQVKDERKPVFLPSEVIDLTI